MEILASKYGIFKGESIGKELSDMLIAISKIEGAKSVIFDKGDYYIDSEDVPSRKIYITNTIGEREWRSGEQRQLKSIAMDIQGISDTTFKFNGARFILRGVMTNVVMTNCTNITIQDLVIDVEEPALMEIKITKKSPLYFDFSLDKESKYVKEKGQFYKVGKGVHLPFLEGKRFGWWIGKVMESTPDNILRVGNPLKYAFKIKEIGKHNFRAYSILRDKIEVGNRYYIYDVRRKDVGIFIDRCKGVTLDHVTQHFNYALGIVAQDSEDLTFTHLTMMNSEHSEMKMCAIADFMHLCMCRGKIDINNGKFEGAGDDCLNVHGIHFKITSVDGNKIVVKFMHPQAYGFNPLRVGDRIEYINKQTLLSMGGANILASKMISEYEIELTLDDAKGASTNYVIEDVSACPSLNFDNNYLNRIITRGILITTRGEVKVTNNIFNSCSMHSILFSDDAASWYESGMVKGALIEGNTFNYCPMYNIYIKPENSVHEGYVHGDFIIRNNIFNSAPHGGIYAKSTKSITLEGNKVMGGDLRIDTHNVGAINRID